MESEDVLDLQWNFCDLVFLLRDAWYRVAQLDRHILPRPMSTTHLPSPYPSPGQFLHRVRNESSLVFLSSPVYLCLMFESSAGIAAIPTSHGWVGLGMDMDMGVVMYGVR